MKLSVVLLVVGASACAVPEDLGQVEQHAGGSCPAWMCGMNSPVVDSYGFHELNLDHQPNAEGFTFDHFEKNGTDYDLSVIAGTIRGTNDTTTIAGGQLVGAQIWVTSDAGVDYAIQIAEVSATDFWAIPPSGIGQVTQTYTLQWSPTLHGASTNEWQDLCANPPNPDDTLGMDIHRTVVFEADRVDAKTKVVSDQIDKRWFNFGCAGSTLAKMYLTGHSYAATTYGFTTTSVERTAMVKMLSADYCGDGTPFTVAGTPLKWQDDHGTMKVVGPASLEARWEKSGATCLMKPRIAENGTPLGLATFPDVEASIGEHCKRPPECKDGQLEPGPEHLFSANP